MKKIILFITLLASTMAYSQGTALTFQKVIQADSLTKDEIHKTLLLW